MIRVEDGRIKFSTHRISVDIQPPEDLAGEKQLKAPPDEKWTKFMESFGKYQFEPAEKTLIAYSNSEKEEIISKLKKLDFRFSVEETSFPPDLKRRAEELSGKVTTRTEAMKKI